MKEYAAALHTDPQDSVANGDLAILELHAGDTQSAITRLQQASESDPGETTAAMDLALLACATGNVPLATTSLQHLLEFSPDDRKATQMLTAKCGH